MLLKKEKKNVIPFFNPGQVSSPLNSTGKSTFSIVPSSAFTITKFNIFPEVSSLCTCTQRAHTSIAVCGMTNDSDILHGQHRRLPKEIQLKAHFHQCLSTIKGSSLPNNIFTKEHFDKHMVTTRAAHSRPTKPKEATPISMCNAGN